MKLSVDRIGGYKLKKKVISRLKENGVKFTFSKTETENVFYSLHQRNHRRIVTIDGKVSYVGGFNIGKEYLGQNQSLGHGVIITCASMVSAADMERKFAEDWKEDTGEKCLYMKVYLH